MIECGQEGGFDSGKVAERWDFAELLEGVVQRAGFCSGGRVCGLGPGGKKIEIGGQGGCLMLGGLGPPDDFAVGSGAQSSVERVDGFDRFFHRAHEFPAAMAGSHAASRASVSMGAEQRYRRRFQRAHRALFPVRSGRPANDF